jgi:hypothetical protein
LLFGTSTIIIIHGEKDTNLFNAKTKREQQVLLRTNKKGVISTQRKNQDV